MCTITTSNPKFRNGTNLKNFVMETMMKKQYESVVMRIFCFRVCSSKCSFLRVFRAIVVVFLFDVCFFDVVLHCVPALYHLLLWAGPMGMGSTWCRRLCSRTSRSNIIWWFCECRNGRRQGTLDLSWSTRMCIYFSVAWFRAVSCSFFYGCVLCVRLFFLLAFRQTQSVKKDVKLEPLTWRSLKNPPEDLVMLDDMNLPLILHTLKHRFSRDHIYVRVHVCAVAICSFWLG